MWSSSTTSKAKSTASPSKRLSSTTKPTTTTTSTSTTKVAAMPSAKTGVSNTTSAATSPRPLASKASLTTSTKRKAPPPPPPTAPTASRSTTTATTSPNASKMTIAASDDAALPSRHTTAPARKTEAATVGGGGALMSEMSGAPLYTAPSIISPRATTFVSAVSGATLTGGERFEPNFYGTTFSFRGSYHCLEVVECRASLWAANKENGDLDIYSCVTGQLTATLHALSPEQGGGGGGGVLIPPTSSMRAHPPSLSQLMNATGSFTTLPKPTALKSTATHMWVGYDNGYVAVYDHLLLVLITGGHFHDGPVVAFAQLHSEEVVSASENGTLVHWGAEDRNFAAIAAVSPQYTKNKDGAITRLAALLNASSSSVEDEAGLQNTVLCSFASGSMYGVDVVSGRCLLRMRGAHSKRVNDVVVVRSCIFSASEDGTVSIWSFQKEREGTSEPLYDFSAKPLASSTSFTSLRAEHSRTPPPLPPPPAAAATTPTTTSGRAVPHVATERSCRLLKRINVSPCARSFVPDHNTHSIWVAYVDGLLERWSANVDDDFGVEEVIREGLLCGGNASTAPHEVVSLLPLGSIETMQVLALSTNGANKVWYGHRNTVEESGARAVAELQAIIKEDARDTTAWKERIERLKGKERARTTRYVALLESIRNKTLRLQYYERWRRAVVSTSTTAKSVNLSSSLESRTTHRLLRRYFSRWCVFYDRKQRQSRRELLAIALSRSTMRERLLSLLRRWQLGIVRQRVAQTSLACIGVMERSSHALILGRYYYIWMHHAQRKHAVNGKLVHRQRTELSEDQVRLLASKAQRQILHRAMHNWYGAILQRKDLLDGATRGPRYKYAETYARWLERFHARTFFSTWRRWAARRIRHAHLAAVVSLRMQHMSFEVQRIYFAKWLQRAYARRVTQRSLEMRETEAKIHELEAEHKDTFERLQLQKRIEELTRLREEEEDRLRQAQSRAGQLHQQCEEAQRIAAEEGGRPPRTSQLSDGLLSTHAAWHRNLVEQQRLSPAILAHMPLAEASQHVFAQLKGNILNLYTDLSLCRLVKDRRKSGSTAAAIFLESFSELKRVIVSSLKGTNTSTTSGGPGSKRSLRWPLSMEALDSIPAHQCANVLTAIKMFVICFDIVSPSELQGILATCEEIVANADWIFLIARTCYLRRKPLLLVNNRQSSSAAKTS